MKMIQTNVWLIAPAVMLLLAGCGDTTLQQGMASWYGPGFHGQQTSSGETYDQEAMTAAHRTLPYDTVVRVVNQENGASVQVRINDRGPYTEGRIIDLSRAAAEELDMLDSGITEVRLELVEAGGPIPDNLEQERFTIQMAEYHIPGYAESFAEDVGAEARVEQVFMRGRERYMVYYGHFQSISEARSVLEELEERGHEGFVKQVD